MLRFGTFLALLLVPWSAASATPAAPDDSWKWLQQHCSMCHAEEPIEGNLSLNDLAPGDIAAGRNLDSWERILRLTASGEMPPRKRPEQPSAESRGAFTGWLQASLDARAGAHPSPGRATLRRLNRAEYANAVRDLLALDVDVGEALPTDDSGYGFDNIADVLSVSPTLMDRYLAVAGRLSRLAVGRAPPSPGTTSFLLPKDGSVLNQGIPSWVERTSDDLPLDSRGGASFAFYAPQDATYEISGWLNANTNNEVDRLPENRITLKVALTAGPHTVGITFPRQRRLDESVQTLHNDVDYVWLPTRAPRQLPVAFVVDGATVGRTTVPSWHESPRFSQANWPRDVLQIDVAGPFDAKGPGDTPSRRKVFVCQPKKAAQEAECAQRILTALTRQAWRRPVTDADVAPLLQLYAQARADGGFEQGIEAAIEAVLVSPAFLFLREQAPAGAVAGSVQPLTDLEVASRLALFLWSGLPDEELVTVAAKGRLREPGMLGRQIDRMLADPRAKALTTNFAGQWLYLRNLDQHRPDVYEFPDFSSRLRRAMKTETELFFASIVRENRSVLDLIGADYTYLNEPLADHYGIAGVKGPAFRKVRLDAGSQRGGLLGQGSILTVTSYANHTSVVKRGQWILTNLLASPPPPPPPDIPALKTAVEGRPLSAREQLELHRSDAACASCHAKMDPLGYALENFDAVGKWRTTDAGQAIDVASRMPDGTAFAGLAGLRDVLLERKVEFTRAFTERLMTYALGRGVEAEDLPSVRAIAARAAADDYRIRTLILGIAESPAFTLRRTPAP